MELVDPTLRRVFGAGTVGCLAGHSDHVWPCELQDRHRQGDRQGALRADAVASISCGWLSFIVVIGLAAQCAAGTWWVDSVNLLAIVWFLVKEGREAWASGECGDGCH